MGILKVGKLKKGAENKIENTCRDKTNYYNHVSRVANIISATTNISRELIEFTQKIII